MNILKKSAVIAAFACLGAGSAHAGVMIPDVIVDLEDDFVMTSINTPITFNAYANDTIIPDPSMPASWPPGVSLGAFEIDTTGTVGADFIAWNISGAGAGQMTVSPETDFVGDIIFDYIFSYNVDFNGEPIGDIGGITAAGFEVTEISDRATVTVTVKSVPDGGTTALLGLLAFGGLGFLRRFMK